MNHPAIEELDKKGYRNFAITLGGIVAVLFGLFFPWVFEGRFPLWPWLFMLTLVVWGGLAPMTLRFVYRGWMKLGILLSKVTTPLVLGIVYYGVIMPTGLIARLFRSDPLRRNCQQGGESYRIESQQRSHQHMENPF